jgi:hypothetical protein
MLTLIGVWLLSSGVILCSNRAVYRLTKIDTLERASELFISAVYPFTGLCPHGIFIQDHFEH